MPPSSKKPTSRKLRKNEQTEMQVYLEHADPNHISVSRWGTSRWAETHGETRSTSRHTFHIGLRVDHDGNYWTCILVDTRDGPMPVEGTIINWGTTEPSLAEVLEHYQNLFLGYLPIDRPGRGGGSGGGGGGGASGGGSGSYQKQVMKDDYGGYFYIDENDEYQQCDQSGNPTYTTVQGHKTKNPRHIALVFINSKNETFYGSRGSLKPCTLKTDSKTGKYYIIDEKGKDRDAQYIGKKPSGRSSGQRSTGGGSGTRTTHGSTHHSSTHGSSAHGSSAQASASSNSSSRPKIYTDPKTKRKYYIGSDNKTHWVS